MDLKTRATLFNKLKQKPTFLWFAPYLGLNVEYMLDVLSLLGIILSFAGYVITLKNYKINTKKIIFTVRKCSTKYNKIYKFNYIKV